TGQSGGVWLARSGIGNHPGGTGRSGGDARRRLTAALLVVSLALLALTLGGGLAARAVAGPQPASGAVMAAWRGVQQAGAYRFTADIQQEMIPLATAGNVGRSSTVQRLYMEGDADLRAETLTLALWSQGGSVLDPASAAQVRVDQDRTYVRQGAGEWQQAEGFTGGFAPGGDFMGFLHAARNIRLADQGAPDSPDLARYTFELDGPGYARYLRDNLQQELARNGALPRNLSLDLPSQYVAMSGSGELWVAPSGLPVRQQIRLDLPPAADADYRTQAEITIDFSFDQAQQLAASPPALLGRALPAGLASLMSTARDAAPSAAGALLTLLAALACVLLLIRSSRSRVVYAAINGAVIAIMLAAPVAQAVEWQRFDQYREQSAPAESPASRTLDQFVAAYNQEHAANLEQPAQRLALLANDSGLDSDRDGLSDAREAALGTDPLTAEDAAALGLSPQAMAPDDGNDSDGDGLTDVQETLLGVNAFVADSDSDGLSDYQEVTGFMASGQRWYSDPQKPSTLDDNVLDGQKCANWPACPDSDGDGTPDLHDRDLDGDGAPNNVDLSPFQAGSPTFSGNAPLALAINGLAANAPTYVEFQLRPTNPARLWYAFNVLDWPDGDARGQVQRATHGPDDPQTFFDICVQGAVANGQDPNAVCAMSPDANGDIKLLPMLEIQAGSSNNSLPSDQELEQFGGIAVRPLNTNLNPPKVVYVPLSLVQEPNSQDRVAFYGKMLYRPGTSWGAAQQVRLVWIVQMLLDECIESDGGDCIAYGSANSVQPVQSYYDQWKLTGLNVRENRGVDFAVIYEDPGVASPPEPDSVLTPLSVALDGAFLSARDCDTVIDQTCYGDGQPDLTVAGRGVGAPTLAARLDRLQNGGVPAVQRWGLPNVLRVVTKSYSHRDQAFGQMASVDMQELLGDVFTSHWSAGAPITPSLLFAREERFRALNLSQVGSGQAAVWNGSSLTLDFRADNGAPLQVVAGLNMAKYRYDSLADKWETLAMEDAWALWDQLYAGIEPGEDTNVAAGKLAILQLYYLSLSRGWARPVQFADTMVNDPTRVHSDQDLAATASLPIGVGRLANVLIINQLVLTHYVSPREVQSYLGVLKNTDSATKTLDDLGTVNLLQNLRRKLSLITNGQSAFQTFVGVTAAATIVSGIVGLTLFSIGSALDNNALKLAGAIFLGLAAAVATIAAPLMTLRTYIQEVAVATQVSQGAAAGKVLGASSEIVGLTKVAAIVGLVIGVAIPWGIFIYQALSGDVAVGTVAFNTVMSFAIASTIVAILMFALSLTAVGFILTAVLGFVDLLMMGLCQAGVPGACFSIIGAVTGALARLIYSSGTAIDFDHKDANGHQDLVKLGALALNLSSPSAGFVHGNRVSFAAPVRTTLYNEVPGGGEIVKYDSFFSANNLRSAAVGYKLDVAGVSAPAPARDSMTNVWQGVQSFHSKRYRIWYGPWPDSNTINFHTGYAQQTIASPWFTLAKGLDQQVPLWFYMGYAMPGYECWTSFCSDITLRGNTSNFLGDSLYLDVFPATLDEFVSLAWDSRFGPQMDHDGDGLLAASLGGLDPNDATADADGDGLSDATEIRLGSNPLAVDSDGDSLGDALEAVLGTDPTQLDTDRDGLSDALEVNGWQFTYGAGLTTLVATDPRLRDSDGDGLDDLAEKNLATNPRAATASPASLALSLSDADRVVTYGSSLVYTATLTNASQPGIPDAAANLTLSGSFASTFPAELGGAVVTSPVLLDRGSQQTRVIPFAVPGGSASRSTAISSRANGSLLAVYPAAPPVTIGGFDQTKSLGLTIDDDRPTSSLTTQFAPAGRTVMLGGLASDPTSSIAAVAVRIDGGPWQDAQPVGVLPRGNARYAWALSWQTPASEGAHTIEIRAADAVGHAQATPTTATLFIDAQSPTVTAAIPAGIAAAVKGADQRWIIHLSGTANDPGSGPAVSGVAQVQVFITPDGAGWQEAQLTPAGGNQVAWTIDYVLPDLRQRYPTGLYQVQVRAQDQAGNETPAAAYATGAVQLDSTPPSVALDVDAIPSNAPPGDVPAVNRIIAPIALGGLITETGVIQAGIAGAEISYTPDMVTAVYPEARLLLYLDDLPGSRLFRDDSGQNRETLCTTSSCPEAGVAGRFGRALRFDGAAAGGQQVRATSVAVDAGAYTLTQWFKANCANCGISSVRTLINGAFNTDRQLHLSGGNLCADVVGGSRESICSADVNYGDGQWHLAAHVVGAAGHQLYIDGRLAASGLKTASSYVGDSSLLLGEAAQATATRFTGLLDEVKLFPAALSAGQVAGLYSSWSPVQVAASGAGVLNSTWSSQTPEGLEGNYQIDLTGSDVLANRNGERISWNQWRGEIDTSPPRLALAVHFTGAGSTARTVYTGYAEDLNLTEANLQFPCADPAISRTYNTLTRPGEPQRLNRIDLTCSNPGIDLSTPFMRACDLYGHCAARRAPTYRLYAATANGIVRANPTDGSGVEVLVPAAASGPTGDLALDEPRGRMYWVSGATIQRANLDGSGVQTVLSGLNSPNSLAVNSSAGKLYWQEPDRIRRANLDGSGVETVATPGPDRPLTSMALDPVRGNLYWATASAPPIYYQTIWWRADLDGQNAGAVTFWYDGAQAGYNSQCWPTTIRDLFVDPASGKLYWIVWNPTCWVGYGYPSYIHIFAWDPNGGGSQWIYRGQVNSYANTPNLLAVAADPRGSVYISSDASLLYPSQAPGFRRVNGATILSGTVYGAAFTLVGSTPITTPDLAVSKQADAPIFLPESSIAWSLTIENTGAGMASGVVVTDTLPSGVTLAAASTNRGDPCALQPGNRVDCDLDQVAVGERVVVQIDVQANPGVLGLIENRAGVQGGQEDQNPLNNTTFNQVNGVTPTATPT
ncbi:MAG: DUF11 domain-containing protein, partial [Anaerolinea sp.]|nr:DUF11 domain-containing protein [Anaerolinea sp.]